MNNAIEYTCPMHPEVEQKGPGSCPKCGMDLEPKNPREAQRRQSPEYVCPMHPEVHQCHPGACPKCGMDLERETSSDADDATQTSDEARHMSRLFWIATALALPVFLLDMLPMVGVPLESWIPLAINQWIQCLLTSVIIFWPARFLFERGLASFRSWNLNMFSLITLGVAAAYLYSLVGLLAPGLFPAELMHHGRTKIYFESAAVISALILLGQMLEARARGRTGEALRLLMQQAPDEAWRLDEGGQETRVPLEAVQEGDRLRVKPGEKVPVDGTVIEGSSTVDESMITGEPVPAEKEAGGSLTGGTLNTTGSLIMQADKVGGDTLLSQIIDMVAAAQRSAAPIQKIADRVAALFVPLVIVIAVLSFISWMIWGGPDRLSLGILNAVSVLIVACPCALGLATPISIMVGVGRGAHEGILIRNAESLEAMEKIDVLYVDKTGTLTEGKPKLTDLLAAEGQSEAALLTLAASLEQSSEHPLAVAIVQAAEARQLALLPSSHFSAITGGGITGKVDGKTIIIGQACLLQERGVQLPSTLAEKSEALETAGKTVIWVSQETHPVGLLAVADPIKETSAEAVRALQSMKIEVHMLTGDNSGAAQHVANELGLNGFQAGLKPEAKIAAVQSMKDRGRIVAMAGDGMNDAPALAEADVGIAMGTGTDVAMESAGITLVKGDLRAIARAAHLSRAVMRNIRQNLFFAFVYNGAGVPIAAGVLYPFFQILLPPMFAALAMSLSSVSVITNALRLKSQKLAGN